MNIPLLDLVGQYKNIEDEIKEAIDEVLASGRYIMGDVVKNFEDEMADYCDVKHAIGVASGTDALLLSLKALDINEGDEVILPTFTFFATAGVVSRLGAKPVFVDIDPDTYNIDTKEIKKNITDKTKAIIPVHLYGQPADMNKIMEIADEYDLKIVEDACQAIGAKYKGRKIGDFGDTTALSFFPSKNLGAYGDAGMILTNDDNLAERLKSLRVHGASPKYYHSEVGYNSRLDAIQAAILRVKLKYLDQWTKNRQRVANKYSELFKKNNLDSKIVLPFKKEDVNHVYHQYVVRVNNRDKIKEELKKEGISTAIYYPIPLHLQECYEDIGYKKGDFPNAEKACGEVLALPIDPKLSYFEIKKIINGIKKYIDLN